MESLTPTPGAVGPDTAQAVGNASGPTGATEVTSCRAPWELRCYRHCVKIQERLFVFFYPDNTPEENDSNKPQNPRNITQTTSVSYPLSQPHSLPRTTTQSDSNKPQNPRIITQTPSVPYPLSQPHSLPRTTTLNDSNKPKNPGNITQPPPVPPGRSHYISTTIGGRRGRGGRGGKRESGKRKRGEE